MMKIYLFAFITLIISSCSSVTKIYLVRHAEKASNTANPELKNPEGFARAIALRDSMWTVKLKGVFCTNFLRTIHTAEPTATDHSMHVSIYNNADRTIDSLAAKKNKRFLVVGHSNTVPGMVRHLGLDPGISGDIPDNDFDNLFIVTIRKKGGVIKKSVERKNYGAPSP
jgi:broad specificity phosphatase PhoE